jgi:hypothetical protein
MILTVERLWERWLPLVVAVVGGLWLAGGRWEWVVGGSTAVFLLLLLLTIFLQPLLGLALALILGPFGALEDIILTQTIGRPLPLDSGQLLLFITLSAWVGRSLARRHVHIPVVWLGFPLLGFIGVMSLTLWDAPSVVLGVRELLKWVEMLLILWLVVDLVTESGKSPSPLTPLPVGEGDKSSLSPWERAGVRV